ncbi:hypothetical protein Ahy_Scaffold1g107163 isoform D [Arachis hypogaea]|uniref:Uncharacterized protein n=1 Tax=Arachis hypogaea TaxID=3818 RepID=A0A444WUT5_ARAHY|nr:hypothetical protein Ahy_Scaffold1g107163 isoform D [Arachis hypogaea]
MNVTAANSSITGKISKDEEVRGNTRQQGNEYDQTSIYCAAMLSSIMTLYISAIESWSTKF